MTRTSFPFEQGAGRQVTKEQWEQMASTFMLSGVIKGVMSELAPFGDSSGRFVKVSSGQAWLQGTVFRSDAVEALAIAANGSGLARIDRLVVRLNRTAYIADFVVLQGTPGASPAVPAISRDAQYYDLALAQVAVANGASTITAGNVTDERGNVAVCGFTGALAGTKQLIQVAERSSNAAQVMSDTNYATLQNMAATLITTGGDLYFSFRGEFSHSIAGAAVELAYNVDGGTILSVGKVYMPSAAGLGGNQHLQLTIPRQRISGLIAGSHTIQMWFRSDTTSGAARVEANQYLEIEEWKL
jgi:hypothetical protein